MIVATLGARGQHKAEQKIKQVVATAEQISRAPVGNKNHRIRRYQVELMKHEEDGRGKWTDRKRPHAMSLDTLHGEEA